MALATNDEIGLTQSMSTVSLPFSVPDAVTRKVSWLRWLVRGYVTIDGLAAAVITTGVAFWLALAIDWLFEPPVAWRVVMWILAAGAVGYVTWRWLLSRLFARLSSGSLALLLERSFPHIEQSLVTTLQAGRGKHLISPQQSELLNITSHAASDRLRQVRLGQVFRYGPLFWKAFFASALVVSVACFATWETQAFDFWLARMRLGTELWPRRVQLTLVGFESANDERVVNVARDDDFQFEVHASLTDGHESPRHVEIRYQLADGRRGRDTLTQIGDAVIGRDEFQRFQYKFKNLAADISFDVIGDDDQIRDLRLRVVERPQIVRTILECEFPSYLGWAPQTLPFSGRVEVPYGTAAVCQVMVNKPLQKIEIHDPSGQQQIQSRINDNEPRQFSFSVDSLTADRVFLVTLQDTDGVGNREPYRLMYVVVPDEVPEVSVQLRGIGSAVTSQATIPFVGTIADDHGVMQAWIEGEIDNHEPQLRILSSTVHSQREKAELGRFDLAEVDSQTDQRSLLLEPGERITLAVKARDAYDLTDEPHVGTSQKFVLDVVTDSELRALLEKRELGLRQRFEAIHEKMISTRDLLNRIEVNSNITDNDNKPQGEGQVGIERDKLRVSGILQSVTQIGYETLGVAEGFEDIVIELANNRIATEELNQRLGRDIAEPLREVAGGLLPELEKRVQQVMAALETPPSNSRAVADAVIQADLVAEEMQRILNRMLELESYNELVELLRTIVDDQKQLNEETKVRRREKLRSLLDDE
jgi:hypothetical protein